jgi:integrase
VSTITRWCESGRLPAISKPYGHKVTYLVAPATIEMVLNQKQQVEVALKTKRNLGQHSDFVKPWLTSITKGLLNGRAFSRQTVDLYGKYAQEFFKRSNQLTPATLEAALGRIPSASISKRQNFYKAMVCLGKYLIKQGMLEADFLTEAKPLSPKRHLPPKRKTITAEQLQVILNACDNLQDRLIIQILASTGIRSSELCALKMEDIDLLQGVLVVKVGKGGKRRRVGLSKLLIQLLNEYIRTTDRTKTNFLLLDMKGKPLDRNGMFQRVQRIGKKVDIPLGPHMLRRAFVTINANAGKPLQMLQMACGHSDITTTRSYCLTSENEVIEAMKTWE